MRGHSIPRPKNPSLEDVKQKQEAQQKHAEAVVQYKSQAEEAIKKLKESFKDYERNPERHPKYSEEWKMFWSRKFKELLAKGKDANSYDYKPEWVEFWVERMHDLHRMDVDKVKEDLRKQLGLSFKEVEAINETEKIAKQNEILTSLSANVKIDDDQPIVEEPVERPFSELCLSHGKDNDLEPIISDEVFEGPETLVSLCQLLTKLEPELGLFAEAIFDMFAKAVALERVRQNSSNELLLSVENCNLFETVKEKLNGVSIASMIAPNKVFAVKRAVNSITTLLNEGSLRKPETSTVDVRKQATESVDPQANIKAEISSRIAEVLIMQGRTNVSPEELEAIVETFTSENPVDFMGNETVEKPETVSNSSEFEGLTDENLQALLRNFGDLGREEQSAIIKFLSQVEAKDPERVERLKKFIGDVDSDAEMH